MKPYKRANKKEIVELRTASTLGRLRILTLQFLRDVRALWRHGAPFPTFLKMLCTLFLCLLALMPLFYPIFVVAITYFTYESLAICVMTADHAPFHPVWIMKRLMAATFRSGSPVNMWKVREVLTRAVLVAHSIATSIDYLCVMQGLLEDV